MSAESPRTRGTGILAVAGVVAVLAAGFGVGARIRARSSLRQTTLEQAAPIVTVADRTRRSDERAGSSGQRRGDRRRRDRRSDQRIREGLGRGHRTVVAKGQPLADIETPEVDQQLRQAEAQLSGGDRERAARAGHGRSGNEVDRVTRRLPAGVRQRRQRVRGAALGHGLGSRQLGRLGSSWDSSASRPRSPAPSRRATSTSASSVIGSAGGPARELFRIATTGKLRAIRRCRRSTPRRPRPASPWSCRSPSGPASGIRRRSRARRLHRPRLSHAPRGGRQQYGTGTSSSNSKLKKKKKQNNAPKRCI